MNGFLLYPVLALVTVVVAYSVVAVIHHWALRGNALDVPNARSSHMQPIPRGGGLAIALCTLLGLWATFLFTYSVLSLATLLSYSVGALLIAVISWLDDVRSVSNKIRFGVHTLAALIVIFGVGWWQVVTLPLVGKVTIGWVGIVVTLFWLIGLTNAYNFMDGIDGLAGGQAVIVGLAWAVLGWVYAQPVILTLSLLIVASSFGFLLHNWPPARIFMGDVGSTFLGFTFAFLTILGIMADPRLAFVGTVLLWPFIFDATFTILRRLRRGENIFQAHRSHLYQRLVIAGQLHQDVTSLYLVLTLIGCAFAALWLRTPSIGSWLLWSWLIASSTILYSYVWRLEANIHLETTPTTIARSSSSEPS